MQCCYQKKNPLSFRQMCRHWLASFRPANTPEGAPPTYLPKPRSLAIWCLPRSHVQPVSDLFSILLVHLGPSAASATCFWSVSGLFTTVLVSVLYYFSASLFCLCDLWPSATESISFSLFVCVSVFFLGEQPTLPLYFYCFWLVTYILTLCSCQVCLRFCLAK